MQQAHHHQYPMLTFYFKIFLEFLAFLGVRILGTMSILMGMPKLHYVHDTLCVL